MFAFTGWDATVYVNEEVRHRRKNPGRAAMLAVACLAVIYTVSVTGLQGIVSPARLQAHSASALVYLAQALGGSGWAKVMALALALSVIGSTGTSIVVIARILYGMASYRALPGALSTVRALLHARGRQRRHRRPADRHRLDLPAAASVQGAFSDLIDDAGILYIAFYVLTAMATVAYYRRRIFTSVSNALFLGILPVAAAGFLVWMIEQALEQAPPRRYGRWSASSGLGVLLMLWARIGARSNFFQLPRESAPKEYART